MAHCFESTYAAFARKSVELHRWLARMLFAFVAKNERDNWVNFGEFHHVVVLEHERIIVNLLGYQRLYLRTAHLRNDELVRGHST